MLSDLELLLRLTEPARSATALFAYACRRAAARIAPRGRTLTLAGAGHCPPLVVGDRRSEFVETSLSAPLGMLSCWEAPSVELTEPGESLLLYTDGLLHRTGEPADRAFARLHAAAPERPAPVRDDPDAWPTTSCAPCCPTVSTRPTAPRTWCCWPPASPSTTGLDLDHGVMGGSGCGHDTSP